MAASAPIGIGLNPLEAVAAQLLSLITRLKNTTSHPDPERLRQRMIEEMKAFTVSARDAAALTRKRCFAPVMCFAPPLTRWC
jgi:type VI protein secretion system component VasF